MQSQSQPQSEDNSSNVSSGSSRAPRRKGLIGRIIAASDGTQRPIPPTTWINATSAEAAHLELLEGRHPLALAHFANHPPAGAAPNTVIASFKVKVTGGGGSSSSHGVGGSSSSSSMAEDPCLRAYVPNIDYCEECNPKQLLHDVSGLSHPVFDMLQ